MTGTTGIVDVIMAQDYEARLGGGDTAIALGPENAKDLLAHLPLGSVRQPILENLQYIATKSEGTLKVVPTSVMAEIQAALRGASK